MAFELSRSRSIDANVRLIAVDQLDQAIGVLRRNRRGADQRAEAIHEARKRAKMVRALARLAAPGLGGAHRKVNALVRDGARQLSEQRDARALLGTWNRVTAARPDLAGLEPVGIRLAARADATGGFDLDEHLDQAIEHLTRARHRVESWELVDGIDAVRLGLRSAQRRAGEAMRAVSDEPSDARLHELRKRVKDLWYHGRLLRPASPSLLDGYVSALHSVSDALGDDHDLAVLAQLASGDVDGFGGGDVVARLDRQLATVRTELQRRALPLVARVVAEPPKAFARRLTAYVELWYEMGDELPAGAVDEVLGE